MHGAQGIEQAASGLWRSILAAAAGNVLEWYDFTVYAYMAPYIAAKFFPGDDPVAGLLAVFATFGLGFVIRPLGGILIGRFGDLKGRKAALLLTIILMAVGTAGIGLVPGRDTVGALAPWLLVFCRLLQGFSAGGEWGSSTAFIYEWAPKGRRGFFSSLQQSSVAGGMLLGSAIAALFGTVLSKTQMADFGWRLPFLLGALIIPIGFYMWRYVDETPVFSAGPTEKVDLRAGLKLAAAGQRHHRDLDGGLLRHPHLHAGLHGALFASGSGRGAMVQCAQPFCPGRHHSRVRRSWRTGSGASRCCWSGRAALRFCPIRCSC